MNNPRIVKQGTWTYGNELSRGVRVTEENFMPGSGDYEDEPEFRDDFHGPCFAVRFESLTEKDNYDKHVAYYRNLAEALSAVKRLTNGTIQWVK